MVVVRSCVDKGNGVRLGFISRSRSPSLPPIYLSIYLSPTLSVTHWQWSSSTRFGVGLAGGKTCHRLVALFRYVAASARGRGHEDALLFAICTPRTAHGTRRVARGGDG